MNKVILEKAYELLKYQNYEKICLVAGICPECGWEVKYTCQNTKKHPVISQIYICPSCDYEVMESDLEDKADDKMSILLRKYGVII